jgi:predicted DNA-binding mobile mystery protein A
MVVAARQGLDARFAQMRPTGRFARPVRGWIQAIRTALGMSAAQLGARLAISQPAIAQLERSEQLGSIELRTLKRVADALDCTLIYALVPNRPLAAMVDERARAVARGQLAAFQHSTLLEKQGLTHDENEAQLEAYLDELDPRRLWDES